MSGETQLTVLLRSLAPERQPGEYVYATVPVLPTGLDPALVFREQEGWTLVLPRAQAEAAGLDFTFPCAWLTLRVHSSLQAVGLIYADSKGMLQDRVAALREANIYERQSYRHIVGLPALLASADGLARAETPFLVVRIMRDGRMDIFATGRYLDCLVETAGALRFRERIVVCDGSRIDTLLAIPL